MSSIILTLSSPHHKTGYFNLTAAIAVFLTQSLKTCGIAICEPIEVGVLFSRTSTFSSKPSLT